MSKFARTGRIGFLPAPACAVAALLLAAAPSAVRAAAPPPPPLVVDASSGFVVSATINRRPVRLRVDPGIGFVLNPAAAERVGAGGGLLQSIFKPVAQIGPVYIEGNWRNGRVDFGGVRAGRRFYYFPRDAVEGADGAIGMADLPHPSVTMRLRATAPGEVTHSFDVRTNPGLGLVYRHAIGETMLLTHFSLMRARTQASAAAGAVLAELHRGTWSGEAREEPIILGVSRPLRPMRFASPLSLQGLLLSGLFVRTADYRGNYALPTDPSSDPSEIVVTGNLRRSRAVFRLTVGADTLARCSSITYIRAQRRLTLSCDPEAFDPVG
ncbi:MAG TPA: hypothetical protein VF702_00075 [Allosphingosinicella sp.]|jgi:hypothetical protein